MLKHADQYSQAFSKDGSTIHTKYGDKKKVSFADYEAGKYDSKDEWMYSSFWYKDFDTMACKTMIRQLISKWGIMSIEFEKAYKNDMAVIREDGTPNYVDNESEDIIEAEAEVSDVFEQAQKPENEAESENS